MNVVLEVVLVKEVVVLRNSNKKNNCKVEGARYSKSP